ncbi:hypothetical protein ACLI4Q_07405 [Natrialbaceae archaeon A-CW1-1]
MFGDTAASSSIHEAVCGSDSVIEGADDAGINRKFYADANAAVDEDGNRIPNRWLISAHNICYGFGTYMVNETDAGLWEVSK